MSFVIIIGAGSGISRSVAELLGRAGHSIGLVSRDPTSLHKLKTDLHQRVDVDVHARAADASDPEQLQSAIAELVAQGGPCAGLIYNAAAMVPGGALDLDVETARKHFDVNVIGALVAAKAVAPAMIEAGHGTILFTGGGLALEPFPEWTSLALGKSALRSLALSLYKELAPVGVHVAVIAVCGIIEPGGPFDPNLVAKEYVRLIEKPGGVEDREVIVQPEGSDPLYNDPGRAHEETTLMPTHAVSD